MNNASLIRQLNAQFNREVSMLARYLIEAAILSDADHEVVRQMYLRAGSEKREQAQHLADQMIALGGTPRLKTAQFSPPAHLREMLRHDANEEQRAEKNYRQLALKAGQKRLATLQLCLETHAAAEHEYVKAMEGLLW